MTKGVIILWLGAAPALWLTSCASEEPEHECMMEGPAGDDLGNELYVEGPPPPPPPEEVVVGVAPSPNFVWVGGYWGWRSGRWGWVSGRWAPRPRPGAVWVPGRWVRRGSGNVWIRGRWR